MAPRPTTATWSPTLIRASWAATSATAPRLVKSAHGGGSPPSSLSVTSGYEALGVEVHDRLLAVGRPGVDDGAGLDLGDGRSHLLDPADELVAERSRVRRTLRLGPHERAQVAVERAVGKGGTAAVEVELGAVADAADQRANADVARPEVRQVLVL